MKILRFAGLRKACKGLSKDMVELLAQLEKILYSRTWWRLCHSTSSLVLTTTDIRHVSADMLHVFTQNLDREKQISSAFNVLYDSYKDIVSLSRLTLEHAEEILEDAAILVTPDSHREAKNAVHSFEAEFASFNKTADSLLGTVCLSDSESLEYFDALYDRVQD